MYQITISDLQREIGDIQDVALKQPVFITRNGKEKYVLLSVEEYRRLKRRDRDVLGVEGLSDQDMTGITEAQVPKEYQHLNELLLC